MESEFAFNPVLAALIVVVCLTLSAFFSASETALTAASRRACWRWKRRAMPRPRSSTGCGKCANG